MVREGRKVPQEDYPPEYHFNEPWRAVSAFGLVKVPGPDGKVIDATGKVLDREIFTGMLKEYYRLRGWDEETGLPQPEMLTAPGLNDPG